MRSITPLITVALLTGAATTAMADGVPDYGWFAAPSTKSRAEVRAELLEAVRSGTLPKSGDTYTPGIDAAAGSTLTRAQVRAEAVEAMRLGLNANGDREHRQPTPAQLESIRQAGLRAITTDSRISKASQ
jgi:hypothetical protein